MGKIIFILGGARSGKSTFAVNLAKKMSKKVVYLATAQAGDREMAQRINMHKNSRPSCWRTIEEPIEITKALKAPLSEKVLILDCLTLYISNVLTAKEKVFRKGSYIQKNLEVKIINDIFSLIKRIKNFKKHIFIIVSNEVGLGIVPTNPLARCFRDIAGRVNQILAQHSNEIYFLAAGVPLKIRKNNS